MSQHHIIVDCSTRQESNVPFTDDEISLQLKGIDAAQVQEVARESEILALKSRKRDGIDRLRILAVNNPVASALLDAMGW